ncbi:coenzyme F420-0:L-glutamate ligase [Nostoc sp. 3335mG]|nr:coenzyme F420-0:L-glutamate ligase [Nostoc sp. 3335mG]
MTSEFSAIALQEIGEIAAGDDLVRIIGDAIERAGRGILPGDIVVVAQKIVSKAEGRAVMLDGVVPSARATELAATTRKDVRVVELVLRESAEVMRAVPEVLIVRHRLGHVMANAGIDRSNLAADGAPASALLLPIDPDASAAALRDGLAARFGTAPGVVISDSFGRAWRIGTVNVAIGVAGLPVIIDRRGEKDRHGRTLEATEIAFADTVAAAAGLAMGEAAEGTPAVLLRGLVWRESDQPTNAALRPAERDLFR